MECNMMKNDCKLVNGEPFNKDLKSVNVKTYEEQRQVLKNYIKEKYFSGKDGIRLVVLTIVLTIILIITLDVPMHWIAIKTHLPIVLLTILNMVISFMVAIRVVATVEMYSRGINKSAYPASTNDIPKGIIVVSPWDKETLFEKFVEYNVIGVKKVDDNTFNILVSEKDGNKLYTTDYTYISYDVSSQMIVGRWYSTIDFIYNKAKALKIKD